jgi:spore germination protein YaaH
MGSAVSDVFEEKHQTHQSCFPEWFFLDPKTGDLKTNVDPEGYKVIKRTGVAAMPILSNNSNQEFHSEGLGKVLNDPQKRTLLSKTNSAMSEIPFQRNQYRL